MKKFIAICMLSLAMACAQGPSAQQTLDVAEDALTTACEQAMLTVYPGSPDAEKESIRTVAQACSKGGRAALTAQYALTAVESVPEEEKGAWVAKMQAALTVLRQATAEILATMGDN